MAIQYIIGVSLLYLLLIVATAILSQKNTTWRKVFSNNGIIYALSLTVYCTAWTFYGSIGRASTNGLGYLGVYLGPTLVAPLFFLVLKKMIRISKYLRITSIADFISSRYGKNITLGVLVSVFCLMIVIPYISIQLKAFDFSFSILHEGSFQAMESSPIHFYEDHSLIFVTICAIIAVIFGANKLDPSEKHPEIVSVVAVESIIKLLAFLTGGIVVTFIIFNGIGDIFSQAYDRFDMSQFTQLDGEGLDYQTWMWVLVLSAFAFLLLPRQFHMSVVENESVAHLKEATWITPLYLCLITLFVLPIAFAGKLLFDPSIEGDTYLLSIPLSEGMPIIATIVYIGGLAAISGMMIISMVSLSIMISNNIFLPLLLKFEKQYTYFLADMNTRLLQLRRVSIIIVMLLSFAFYKGFTINYSLVSVGLISFAGIAQLAPMVFLGLYWKQASAKGAIAGFLVGIILWAYTLPFANLAELGVFSNEILEKGPWGFAFLNPHSLMGIEGMSNIAHGSFWSLGANTLVMLLISLYTNRSTLEIAQSDIFINPEKYYKAEIPQSATIIREADSGAMINILNQILGAGKTTEVIDQYLTENKLRQIPKYADSNFIQYIENHLSGSIGTASANIVLNYFVKQQPVEADSLIKLLDQTYQVYQYSQEIEGKSKELEETTNELSNANKRLQELDQLKNEFISNVTHELRTPLTSIRSIAGILQNYEVTNEEKKTFYSLIEKESKRVTDLVNQVLDLRKLEFDKNIRLQSINLSSILDEVALGMQESMGHRTFTYPENSPSFKGDPSIMKQVIINLVSNAIKFTANDGSIRIRIVEELDVVILEIEDNGIGISSKDQPLIFERFYQVKSDDHHKTQGSGLGLAITKSLIEKLGGVIQLESQLGKGSIFTITLPKRLE
jgi:signal transduction histidine kinase